MRIKGFRETIRWYEQNAKKYTQAISSLYSFDQIDSFINLLPKKAKILDAGCAGGRDSKILSDKGREVIGIGLAKNLINIASKKYPDIKFVHGNFLNLPFPGGYFDGVWCHASLVHFERIDDVKKALSELARVLKKEGIIHVFVKEKTAEKETEIISDVLSKHKRFFRYFTKEEIKRLLENADFEIVQLYDEKDKAGRKEVKWILALGRKIK